MWNICGSPGLVGSVSLAFVLVATGAVQAQSAGERAERVHHAAAGISIVPPAGWHQVVPLPGDAAAARGGSAADRQAFLNELADGPSPTLFLFAKSLDIEAPIQTPSILIRVVRTTPMGPRPVDALIVGMERQADPRLATSVRRTEVSGLPATHAILRDTARVGNSEFAVIAHGYFVPLDNVVLFIDMKAPESSPEATNEVFATALASIRIEP